MKKKKILFIIDSLTCGGAEKSLVSLLPLLNTDKYELYIWMRQQGGAFAPLLPNNVNVVSEPKYNAFESLKLQLGKVVFSLRLRWNRLIHKREHLAETLWKSQGWAMKVPEGNWDVAIAYQQGVPTFLVAEKFHGCKKMAWVNVDVFKAGYNIAYNSKFYRKMDYICPVSDQLHGMMDARMAEFSDKYNTIWDVINPDVTRKLANETVQRLKGKDDEYVFVTTGRLVPQKGHDIAVEAAAELKRKGVKFKWYFIGEGSERPNIEKLIRQNNVQDVVFLLGMHTNPYAFMQQADVYVQTSKFEGFGMTIAEAKILGKPIVSTNFEVICNQITHEKNGLIAEMNGKSVADNIYRIITNSNLRDSIVAEVKAEKYTRHLTEAQKVEALIDC